MKRWSQKVKKQLFLDAVAAAVEVYGLQNWMIEVVFDNAAKYRATCSAELQYQTATIEVAINRIRIFEIIEFAAHEVGHIHTWRMAEILEEWAGDDPKKQKEAEDVYEYVTTQLGLICVPQLVEQLRKEGKFLPEEALEVPRVVVRDKRVKPTQPLTSDAERVSLHSTGT